MTTPTPPFVLNPLPESRTESGLMPTEPGTTHGQYGPRLIITHTKGYASSTATGYWRWCAKCGAWKKAVAIAGAMWCTSCDELWAK